MTNRNAAVNNWSQPAMFPPAVIEVTLRVGAIAGNDDYQLELDWKDPSTDTLLGMMSRPSIHRDDIHFAIGQAMEDIEAILEELAGPF
uniref:Uncharacterized protein n=1 Tax=uncultured prokaryote TaxID=198431 RepID=A0A0H5Q6X8_9ZZZZ|nr:hypothetical protein [uncultured prokaryote]